MSADDSRPNILVVFADQHRGSALGCAGNGDVRTPNVDRLASQGTRLPNACANYPVCGPGRATMLSGQYPHNHGVVVNDLPLDPGTPTIGNAFQDAGYRTGYVGKWHLDGMPREKFTPPGPRRQGFEDFWAVWNCDHHYFDAQYYRDDPEPIDVEGYEPETQTDLALEFLDAEDDRPFCLFLSWGPPHDPYRAVPDRYRDLYDPDELAVRPNVEPLLPSDPDHPAPTSLNAPPIREYGGYDGEPYDYDDVRDGLRDYYAAITALDDQFRRLLDELDRRGIAEDTIVVYTSDHGDMFWSQGNNQKGQPHEESLTVPFVVRWPEEVPEGAVRETVFSHVDVAPTLLSMADLAIPDSMDGRDLSTALSGEDPGPESTFIMNPERGWRGVRTERYTYARMWDGYMDEHVPPQDEGWVLFDNERDPYQRTNRIYDPEYEETKDRLDALLDHWLRTTNDPFYPGLEDYVRDHDLMDAWTETYNYPG